MLLRAILETGSSFILRLPKRMVCRPREARRLSDAARAAGVEADEIVELGTSNSHERIEGPLPRIRLTVPHRDCGQQTLGRGATGFILSPVDNITEDTPLTWRNVDIFVDEWRKHWHG